MIEPVITEYQNFAGPSKIFKLEVPLYWLQSEKHPRLKLFWWVLKMCWKAGKK